MRTRAVLIVAVLLVGGLGPAGFSGPATVTSHGTLPVLSKASSTGKVVTATT